MGVAGPGERVQREGSGLCGHSGERLHLRHAATGRRHEPARLHDRGGHAVRPGDGAGDQGVVADTLAERWPDLIDLDAGRIATGEATIEQVGGELFRLILDVASGRKQTWADHWSLHNAVALFNPGSGDLTSCRREFR